MLTARGAADDSGLRPFVVYQAGRLMAACLGVTRAGLSLARAIVGAAFKRAGV